MNTVTNSARPVPNTKWMPARHPAPSKPQAKDVLFPKDAVAFGVTHHCMNPLIREGQQVLAIPHAGHDLPVGTPVVVASRNLGNLCKLWMGVADNKIILGFPNGENAQPGEMSLPVDDVANIWKILGVWYCDVLPGTGKTSRVTQEAHITAKPSAPQSGTLVRNTAAASAKSADHAALTEFDKVKDRIIFTRTGRPIGYFGGEPGIKQLAWLVKQLLRLPVEGVEVENRGCKDHYLAFTEDAPKRELTDEQLGAIKAFRWYCDTLTIGPYRNEQHVLSVSLFGAIPGSPNKNLLVFADEDKAKICCETIKEMV